MNKAHQLIEQILADKKLKNGQNFQEKIYRDEPILHTAAQMANYLPPEYRQMKKIAISREAFSQPAEWLFYQQGKLMENFEDDCPYRGEFMRYYPTYHTMYDDQLRGYFTWRAAVRHGRIEKTSLSFVFLYIYELLNQIGVHSPEEGVDTLYDFWQQYRELDPRLDRYVRQWLGDYVAYYGLDSGLVSRFADASFDENLLILLHAADHEEGEIFNALMALSSYRIENSKFYKQYPAEVCKVAVAVFTAWSDYCEKNRRKTLLEKLFGRRISCPYRMFQSAVFYDRRRYKDYTYAFNEIHRYTCKDGAWSCEKYYGSRSRSKELGAMLRAVDCRMRQAYGFTAPLKEESVTKVLQGIIDKAIAQRLEQRRREAAPKIEIDLSKLQNIRQSAAIIRDKLIVEEETEKLPVRQEPPAILSTEEPQGDSSDLTAPELRFLRALLYGTEDYHVPLHAAGAMASVVVDAINEKLFDQFGDTVLLFDGDQPELIEDYIEDLKGMISCENT